MSEIFTRRDFLKILAAASGSALLVANLPSVAKALTEEEKQPHQHPLKGIFVTPVGQAGILIDAGDSQIIGPSAKIVVGQPTPIRRSDGAIVTGMDSALVINSVQDVNGKPHEGSILRQVATYKEAGQSGTGHTDIFIAESISAPIEVFTSGNVNDPDYPKRLDATLKELRQKIGDPKQGAYPGFATIGVDYDANGEEKDIRITITALGRDPKSDEKNPKIANTHVGFRVFRAKETTGAIVFDRNGRIEIPVTPIPPKPQVPEVPAQVEREFIPLNTKRTEFSETLKGVTTKIVLSMDDSMEMRAIDEKADAFVKNTKFPGGSNEAMNAYARQFLFETAKLTNESAKEMTKDEYLNALAFAQAHPEDDDAWKKVEINVYDDATKTMQSIKPSANLTLDFTYVNGSMKDKMTNINPERPNTKYRNELDPNANTLRMIRGLDNYGQSNTARTPFVNDMIRRPSLLKSYKGREINLNKATFESKELKRCICVGNSGVCAFKLYRKGEPANTQEAQQNP